MIDQNDSRDNVDGYAPLAKAGTPYSTTWTTTRRGANERSRPGHSVQLRGGSNTPSQQGFTIMLSLITAAGLSSTRTSSPPICGPFSA